MVCAGIDSVACICSGVPLAMLHVSHGGAKIVTCTRLLRICCVQNLMVDGSIMSLCGASSLDKSTEMGYI